VPRWIYTAIILVNLVMLVPPVLIARARVEKTRHPRIHIFPDMDHQASYKPQEHSPLFADGRAMRPHVAGTVARGQLQLDDHFYRGRTGDQWAETFPPQLLVDARFVERGRQRFQIYCSPCHGATGHGDGIVQRRSEALEQAWTVGDLGAAKPRAYPVGHIFNVITNGILTMPPYRSQIPVEDRWAIVAWVRALQYSQAAELATVPAPMQSELRATKPPPEPAGSGPGGTPGTTPGTKPGTKPEGGGAAPGEGGH